MEKQEELLLQVMQLIKEYQLDVRMVLDKVMDKPFELLSTGELCEKLHVSIRTLHRYVVRFKIPVHRIGNRNFYFLTEVRDRMIDQVRG